MEPFDHSIIASSIYKVKAIEVRKPLLDILKIKALEKAPLSGLLKPQKEFAFTSHEFLRKITAHTLLPNTPSQEIEKIVKSDSFSVTVNVRPLDDRKPKEGPTTVSLATLNGQKPQIPDENYVGLSRDWFIEREVPYFSILRLSVDVIDFLKWRKYEREGKLKTHHRREYEKPEQSGQSSSYNFFNENAIAEMLAKDFSKEV